MRADDAEVRFEMELRPKQGRTPTLAEMKDLAATDKVAVQNEVVYIAHIYTRHSEHHAEGPTPAMALVDAALNWERFERGRR